mgnify:CR=1 FL=1
MGKIIEKGQTSNCNQSNTPLQYEGENKALQRLNKGLAECEPTTSQIRRKIAYKLGVRYELVFSV